MAVTKICGIETEYSIIQRGVVEQNPVHASSILVDAYGQRYRIADDTGVAPAVHWDFQDEMPGNDARGFAPMGSMPPIVETHLVNAVLTNGARFYVDHAHPELSTPECANALEVTKYDKSGEIILQRAMEYANQNLPEGEEIIVYKDNSDGKGNSYGCHENYLMDRLTPFGEIISHATAHFISRQIFTGSGKVGCEIPGIDSELIPFQITQRADFFEEEVGLETTLKRPIINTRDEPHADPKKYRRLHVICGDANMSETATFLKVGSTAILLSMIEDSYMHKNYFFENPVAAMRNVSHDLSLKAPLLLKDGSSITALEIQWEIFASAKQYIGDGGDEFTGGEVAHQIIATWERILTGLESEPKKLLKEIDWVAKKILLDQYAEKKKISFFDPRIRSLAVQYHDIRQEQNIVGKLGMKNIISNEEVEYGVTDPPSGTRAYFRGICLKKWPESIVSANWDSIVFKLDDNNLKRVPILEPSKGSKSDIDRLVSEAITPRDLINALETVV